MNLYLCMDRHILHKHTSKHIKIQVITLHFEYITLQIYNTRKPRGEKNILPHKAKSVYLEIAH